MLINIVNIWKVRWSIKSRIYKLLTSPFAFLAFLFPGHPSERHPTWPLDWVMIRVLPLQVDLHRRQKLLWLNWSSFKDKTGSVLVDRSKVWSSESDSKGWGAPDISSWAMDKHLESEIQSYKWFNLKNCLTGFQIGSGVSVSF